MGVTRLLLLADTHLGFDLPARPRVRRRRRGPDFFASYERALAPALRGEVDLVVHGGDLLFRARVPPALVERAFVPLRRIADAGVPVVVVPGNHERSRIPYPLLVAHPRIHVFDRPRTFVLDVGGNRLALTGFPYARNVRRAFPRLLHDALRDRAAADLTLLCIHHCFEGATVGPVDHVFRTAPDVIRAADVPAGVHAVLSGHIHRHQVLTRDLRGRPLAAPVLYPGSTERTSFAEARETKGYLRIELDPSWTEPRWRFVALPTRPMVTRDLADVPVHALEARAVEAIAAAPRDAILRLRLADPPRPGARELLTAARLRSLAPPTMNVEVTPRYHRGRGESTAPRARRPRAGARVQ